MKIRTGFIMDLIAFFWCVFFAEPIVRLFVSDNKMLLKEGVTYLKLISYLCHLLPAVTNGIQGYFRGIGDLKHQLDRSMVNVWGRACARSICFCVWFCNEERHSRL